MGALGRALLVLLVWRGLGWCVGFGDKEGLGAGS